MSHVGRKQRLSGGKHRRSGVAIEADPLRAEIAITRTHDVEYIHEQIEVVSCALQGNVFDDAKIQIGEPRLTKAIPRGNCVIQNRAIVPVVGVVLRIEADDRRVRLTRARNQNWIELEAYRQIQNSAEIKIIPDVLQRVRSLRLQIERVQRGVDVVRPQVGVVVEICAVAVSRKPS
jgi:hypothetical protein